MKKSEKELAVNYFTAKLNNYLNEVKRNAVVCLPLGIARVSSVPVSAELYILFRDGVPISEYNPTPSESNAIKRFLDAQPTRRTERLQDTLLRLVFNCGISNEKGFITPAYLKDTCKTGSGETITFADNVYLDAMKLYREANDYEKFSYNRRIKSNPLPVPDLSRRLTMIYDRLFEILNEDTKFRVPFMNLDVRLVADTYESIKAGKYQIYVTDINPDIQDFLADFGSFADKRLINDSSPMNCVVKTMINGMAQGSALAVIAPKKWQLRGFYTKELEILTSSLIKQGFKVDVIDREN